MDTLSKMSEEFKTEVKQVKNDMKSVKKDIVSIKQAFKSRSRPETPEQKTECLDISEFLEPEKPKTPRSTRKKTNSYREPKVPPTIVELFNSSEEEQERSVDGGCSKMAGGDLPPDPDNDAAAAAHGGEKSVLQSVVGSNFEDNYLENFNDDHIRKLVFSSQESSDYHHESSDYHESDAVSDEDRNGHFDKSYNVKRIFSKKFLYK